MNDTPALSAETKALREVAARAAWGVMWPKRAWDISGPPTLSDRGVIEDRQTCFDIADAILAARSDHQPTGEVEEQREAIEYAADVRWLELAQGSPFTIIDRQMLGNLYRLGQHALDALNEVKSNG